MSNLIRSDSKIVRKVDLDKGTVTVAVMYLKEFEYKPETYTKTLKLDDIPHKGILVDKKV